MQQAYSSHVQSRISDSSGFNDKFSESHMSHDVVKSRVGMKLF